MEEKSSVGLKSALKTLKDDLREVLKKFDIEPKGDVLFPIAELSDQTESHQNFYDPLHCDGIAIDPETRQLAEKNGFVDANQSDYPLKVAKAYWNATLSLYDVLIAEPGMFSTVNEFRKKFEGAMESMNKNFAYIDDQLVNNYQSQTPRVVDQRTLGLAKIYQQFVGTMMKDSDPLQDIRSQAALYRGGALGVIVDEINKNRNYFETQFKNSMATLNQRIGVYEARINENIVDPQTEKVTLRTEKLKYDADKLMQAPLEFRDKAKEIIASIENFHHTEFYKSLPDTKSKIEALEQKMTLIDSLSDVDVAQNIQNLEKMIRDLDILYINLNVSYAQSIYSGELSVDQIIVPLQSNIKDELRNEFEKHVELLHQNKAVVEERSQKLHSIKKSLEAELKEQRSLLKSEALSTRGAVVLAQMNIDSSDFNTLREDQTFVSDLINKNKALLGDSEFENTLINLQNNLTEMILIREKYLHEENSLESLGNSKTDTEQLAEYLSTAKIPIDENHFALLEKELGWSAFDKEKWAYITEKQGWTGGWGVTFGLSQDPLLSLRGEVNNRLLDIQKQESDLKEDQSQLSKRQVEIQEEFEISVKESEATFGVLLSYLYRDIQKLPTDNEEQRTEIFDKVQKLKKLGQQLFGKNPLHQALFEEITQEYYKPPEDKEPNKREELFDQYFGEKGKVKAYLDSRKFFSVRDKLVEKTTGSSDTLERTGYLDQLRSLCDQYRKTGKLEVLIQLQAQVNQDLEENKFVARKTPPMARIEAFKKARKPESEPDPKPAPSPKSMNALLKNLQSAVREELNRRIPGPAPKAKKSSETISTHSMVKK
jgi:hypothetical protein